ncbi:unnamed protein product [Pseudo-nitzschia multistriata]|uniref:Protein kinase domain-containing protein n=1 Tax=Pseudo-nitzschia multistriata TaxID=183589 RepID=A0A448ZQJ2_9STRA|nr:unnamed protein product [Pseudo-nitzschia multistriata]
MRILPSMFRAIAILVSVFVIPTRVVPASGVVPESVSEIVEEEDATEEDEAFQDFVHATGAGGPDETGAVAKIEHQGSKTKTNDAEDSIVRKHYLSRFPLFRFFQNEPPKKNQYTDFRHKLPFFVSMFGGHENDSKPAQDPGRPTNERVIDDKDGFHGDREKIEQVMQRFYEGVEEYPRFARSIVSSLIATRSRRQVHNRYDYRTTQNLLLLRPRTIPHNYEKDEHANGDRANKDDEDEDDNNDELQPGTVLEVSSRRSPTHMQNGNSDVSYELVKKIPHELGEAPPKHYSDFAYTSVIIKESFSSTTSPFVPVSVQPLVTSNSAKDAAAEVNNNGNEDHENSSNKKLYFDRSSPNVAFFPSDWWKWWMPFSDSDWWKTNGSTKDDFRTVESTAFAGGSNGEVWRGRRVCQKKHESESDADNVNEYAKYRDNQAMFGKSNSQNNIKNKKQSWKEENHEGSCFDFDDTKSCDGDDPDGEPIAGGDDKKCDDQTPLVLKRLKIERGYLLLEAGLREIYFGKLISRVLEESKRDSFTVYVDHFFREVPQRRRTYNNKRVFGGLPTKNQNNDEYDDDDSNNKDYQAANDLELWIVFEDAGPSLRSYIYTPLASDGGFVMHQHSKLWTMLRTFTNEKRATSKERTRPRDRDRNNWEGDDGDSSLEIRNNSTEPTRSPTKGGEQLNQKKIGQQFMQKILREILEAAAELHRRGIVHRDIKPSNVMCKSDKPLSDLFKASSSDSLLLNIDCRLGDFSSGWDRYTSEKLFTKGPTPGEQTDEYAPPESYVGPYWKPFDKDKPHSYDSWSIGVLALELLLGTPQVFSVDQRTNALLTNQMKRAGASDDELEYALFLAALSNFCIFVPSNVASRVEESWPLGRGDPLHKTAMVTESCTLQDFHRALRARDPLGIGFDSSTDLLLHLIWKLLAYEPNERITAEEALNHPYFISPDGTLESLNRIPGFHNALESQMLDPRIDFDAEDEVKDFECPRCGRVFHDWRSCHQHANLRKHAKFCSYNRSALPSCINTHSMLPEHATSGWCDLQGRRPTIEDFHSIHLHQDHQFYGIFDGHTGNLASKFATSELYRELLNHLPSVRELNRQSDSDSTGEWKERIKTNVTNAFEVVHERFLDRINTVTSHSIPKMDQSGTTATAMLVTDSVVIVAVLGDSRGVMASAKDRDGEGVSGSSKRSRKIHWKDFPSVSAIPFSIDHVASDPRERELVIQRGGFVSNVGGMPRVNGTLAITRSIGDANLAPVLSREPSVVAFDRSEMKDMCGDLGQSEERSNAVAIPCFVILASDGLWDVMSNQEAVDFVVDTFLQRSKAPNASDEIALFSQAKEEDSYEGNVGVFQESAERLAVEAYVRGSTDNIGVCVVAID